MLLAQPSASALNHLLIQSGWACTRLQRFAGRTVRFDLPLLTLSFTLQPDGTVQSAADGTSADVHCVVSPGLLARLAANDLSALDDIHCEGDAGLLEEVFFLAHNLRWDAAEDLSRYTGDIAAERIVQFAANRVQHWRNAAFNLSQAAAEFLTEERPLLAKPEQLADFSRDVSSLRDATDALERRLDALTQGKAG